MKDRPCRECGGTGKSPQTFDQCGRCWGMGKEFSPALRRFLEAMDKHFSKFTAEELAEMRQRMEHVLEKHRRDARQHGRKRRHPR